MSEQLPQVYLARHGETEWSLSGQHTGRTDIPLTARGEDNARRLGERLRGRVFALALTSPLQRASRTAELAGFTTAHPDPDLMEWNYGEYEGKRTADIRKSRPGWWLFRDGCPGGESPEQIGARADRVIARVRAVAGDVLLFAHGHILRVVPARDRGGQYPRLRARTRRAGVAPLERHTSPELSFAAVLRTACGRAHNDRRSMASLRVAPGHALVPYQAQ
jgi:broad specificity phosphatase PhoE